MERPEVSVGTASEVAAEERPLHAAGRVEDVRGQPEGRDDVEDAPVAGEVPHPAELDRVVKPGDTHRSQPSADSIGPLEQRDRPVGPRRLHTVGDGRPRRRWRR
jgi:hypothetical protein